MSGCLVHRGPDSNGVWVDESTGIGLGHRRLAILDLSNAGHQPMASSDGRYQVVFNGEIYNFRSLRAKLERQGCHFTSNSDTEVLLSAIQYWGLEKGLQEFQGMFAFALWDKREKKLTLCRDRMGEKPLFYGWLGQQFVFASELSAVETLGQQLRIDRGALAGYFNYGYVPAPLSIYQHIYKLIPGSYLTLKVSAARVDRHGFSPSPSINAVSPTLFWDLSVVVEEGSLERYTEPEQAVNDLDALLQQVISDQSIADVPLGAFISGGTDSSTYQINPNYS